MRGAVLFRSTVPERRPPGEGAVCVHGWNLSLPTPLAVHEAWRLEEVVPLLRLAEAASRRGLFAALAVAYEAAPAFDPAMTVRHAEDAPLAWVALHRAPGPLREIGGKGAFSSWRSLTPRWRYAQCMREIKECIRLGETYQVNYTMAFAAEMHGSAQYLFHRLAAAQGAGFCAWFQMGRRQVLSFSPELFFLRKKGALVTRPMKGTAPRGRFAGEDVELACKLAACPKNRAENVMIVDLLRNDLGRVAAGGTVAARRLFRVERYPTVLQMTSTVTARLRGNTPLEEIFGALFPCGSVTGAPKVRTMECIAALEDVPRGFYCGALGFLAPGGDAVFNVPIRTLNLEFPSPSSSILGHNATARFHVGGGVTHDSAENAEYRECLDKMAFLQLSAREFRLLETLLLAQGRYLLVREHLDRLASSAGRFGFCLDKTAVRRALEGVARANPGGRRMVRLLLAQDGSLHLESKELALDKRVWRVAVSPEPVDSRDPMLFHKTDARENYSRRQAAHPDCDEVLLCNEQGQLTEGCRSNLVLLLDGERVTPSLGCGLLPGVLRQELLRRGAVVERVLDIQDLRRATSVWCVNSLRGWRRAVLIR